jgi:hypothetical protein
MSSIMAEELVDDMKWEMRWLPSYFYRDEEEYEMRWLQPYFYEDDKDKDVLLEAEDEITIGSEPIITPSSYMTFEQICLAVKLTSAIKIYHLEKAKKESSVKICVKKRRSASARAQSKKRSLVRSRK